MNLGRPLLAVGIAIWTGYSAQAEQALTKIWSEEKVGASIFEGAVSPDGKLIATGGFESTVSIYNTADGSLNRTLSGHGSRIVGLRFSNDGSMLGSVSRDETLKLWSMTDGATLLTVSNIVFGGSANESALAFALDDSFLISPLKQTTNNLGFWKLEKAPVGLELMHERRGHGSETHTMSFSPNGELLATAGGIRAQDLTVKIWNAATGELLKTLQTSNTYGIDAVAFSPDGKVLATGTDDLSNWAGKVELWNTSDWSLKHRLDGKGFRLAFSPDGEFLLAARDRKTIDLWRVETGTLLRSYSLPVEEYGSLATMHVLPDGTTVVLGGFIHRDGTAHGRLTAVRFPGREVEAIHTANGLRLNWLSAKAILQRKSALTEEWLDVGSEGGTAEISAVSESAFYRLKWPE